MDDFDTSDDCDAAPIQIDVYGVKARVRPVAEYVAPPKSWREVLTRVNQHLMTLALAPLSVPAAVVEGSTNFVRGFGTLFSRRVSDAHEEADHREIEREERVMLRDSTSVESHSSAEAIDVVVDTLQGILDEYHAKGLHVEIRKYPGGQVGVLLLPDECISYANSQIEALLVAEARIDDQSQHMGRSWDDLGPVERNALSNRPISELNLSVRVRKLMVRLGLSTIAELVVKSPVELLKTDGFGDSSLRAVQEALAKRNLRLRK